MKQQIYFLICPVAKKVSYVGVSIDAEKRYQQHLVDKSDCSKAKWIQALLEVGQKPTLAIVGEAEEQEAKAEEARWITFGLAVGWPLRNNSLPNPDYIRNPYALPGYEYPQSVRETILRYGIPDRLRVAREFSLFDRIKLLFLRKSELPDVLRVWFRTIDNSAFYMYYKLVDRDQAVYEASYLTIIINGFEGGDFPNIRETRYSKIVEYRDNE